MGGTAEEGVPEAPHNELRAGGVPPQQEKRGAQLLPGSQIGCVAVLMNCDTYPGTRSSAATGKMSSPVPIFG